MMDTKTKFRFAIVASLSVLVASCQETFLVKIETSGNSPRFTFHENKIIYHTQISPCLTKLQVHEMRAASGPVKMWDIRAQGRECVAVESISYGVAPKGFAQQAPAATLRVGPTYRVEVEDKDLRGGSGEFQQR